MSDPTSDKLYAILEYDEPEVQLDMLKATVSLGLRTFHNDWMSYMQPVPQLVQNRLLIEYSKKMVDLSAIVAVAYVYPEGHNEALEKRLLDIATSMRYILSRESAYEREGLIKTLLSDMDTLYNDDLLISC